MTLKELKEATLLQSLNVQRQLVKLDDEKFTDRDLKSVHRSQEQLTKLLDRLLLAMRKDERFSEDD